MSIPTSLSQPLNAPLDPQPDPNVQESELLPTTAPTLAPIRRARRSQCPIALNYSRNTIRRKAQQSWLLKTVVIITTSFVSLSLLVSTVLALAQKDVENSSFKLSGEEDTSKIYPASIPYWEEESDCLEHEKEWLDGKCWDAEHSHLF